MPPIHLLCIHKCMSKKWFYCQCDNMKWLSFTPTSDLFWIGSSLQVNGRLFISFFILGIKVIPRTARISEVKTERSWEPQLGASLAKSVACKFFHSKSESKWGIRGEVYFENCGRAGTGGLDVLYHQFLLNSIFNCQTFDTFQGWEANGQYGHLRRGLPSQTCRDQEVKAHLCSFHSFIYSFFPCLYELLQII